MRTLFSAAAALSLLAAEGVAAATPVVTVIAPTPGVGVGDQLGVLATATTSPYVVTNVHAQVLGAGVDLTGAPNYFGTVDLSAIPVGPITLTVSATDATSAIGSIQVALIHDHAPTISVATIAGTVARPQIRLQARCADADAYGCATITVKIRGDASNPDLAIATATGASLDQTISLSAYEGKALTLDFTAADTAGLSTLYSMPAYVDTSTALVEVAHGDGPILDFDASRLLYAGATSLAIRPRGGGVDTTVASVTASQGFLTPLGAIWPTGEWRSGVALTTDGAVVAARGDYALLMGGSTGAALRNVSLNTTTTIDLSPYWPGRGHGDVAANGDVVLSLNPKSEQTTQQHIYRYRAGALSLFSTVIDHNAYPVTDGVNIAYRNEELDGTWIATYLNTQQVTVGPGSASTYCPDAFPYAVRNGWIAFVDTPLNFPNHCMPSEPTLLFTRSSTGLVALASSFVGRTALDGLADNGEVIYFVNGTRYLGTIANLPATAIATNDLGRGVYSNGQWYVVMGASLFAVVPGGAPDGGAPDAGPGDAGGDAAAGDSGSSDAGTSDASGSGDAGTDATLDAGALGIADAAASGPSGSPGNPTPEAGTAIASRCGDGGGCSAA